jgi:hypothetical protein
MKRGEYDIKEDIPIIINSYNDIFSDFDPRPYSQRAISGEFLNECRKASNDKKGKIEVKLFIQGKKRNLKDETKIKRRLKEHFKKHCREKKNEVNKIRTHGTFWAVFGAAVMGVSAFFLLDQQDTYALRILLTLIQPTGWFFLWEGLGKIFLTAQDKMPDYHFYKKMAGVEISFSSC